MIQWGIPSVSGIREASVPGSVADRRTTTLLGIAVGFLDVLTTAEHLLVGPVVDGNPLLIGLSRLSPLFAYGAFVGWFLLVAGAALTRTDAIGYSADTYLFVAFGLAGVANAAYLLFGTTVFKRLVGQFPLIVDAYILVGAPVGSLLVGFVWASVKSAEREI